MKIAFNECDVFAPCAADGAINGNNADKFNCNVIIEGANGPTTFAADNILKQRGIQVIPDMLANVGGVACSYFEWLKNLDHVAPGRMNKRQSELDKKKLVELLGYRFPKDSPVMKHLEGAKEIDIVNSALEVIMVTATEEHWAYAKKKNYTLREACLGNSLQKLASRFEESGMLM